MGLDIILGKPEKLNGRDPKELFEMIHSMDQSIELSLYQIDENNENDIQFAEFFKDFVFESEEKIYDIERLLSEKGYTLDDIETLDNDYPYRDDTFYMGLINCYNNISQNYTKIYDI